MHATWLFEASVKPNHFWYLFIHFCFSRRLECSSTYSLVLTSLLFEANISAWKAFLPSPVSSTLPQPWHSTPPKKTTSQVFMCSHLLLLNFMGCPITYNLIPVSYSPWVLVCPIFWYAPWHRVNDQYIFRRKECWRTALGVTAQK